MDNYLKLPPEQVEFVKIAPLDDLPPGERLFVEIGDLPVVLFNIAGEVFAIGDICSHDDGPLGDGDVSGHEVYCPRHGASFDLRTGKALSLPAIVDIPAYPVKIEGGSLFVGIPR